MHLAHTRAWTPVYIVYTIAIIISRNGAVMRFEWSKDKEARNIVKHDVAFDTAKSIWGDGRSIEFYDLLHSVGEDRFIRIGHSSDGQFLTVVFTEREQDIRIISARNASAQERMKYEERI